jgi:protein-S-isoprenylcysteine O-methyltransferase Ste14
VGIAAFTGGLWLLWRSHADLGHNWSAKLSIAAEPSLVTRGVFRYIRHPMYASHVLWAIAQALLIQNWIAGLASLVVFLPLYLLRVPHEEDMMLKQFGDQYRAYMDRTGGVIPRLCR